MTALYAVHCPATNMTASVFPNPKGFAVVLRDDDSGETASVVIFPTRAAAEAKADTVLAPE